MSYFGIQVAHWRWDGRSPGAWLYNAAEVFTNYRESTSSFAFILIWLVSNFETLKGYSIPSFLSSQSLVFLPTIFNPQYCLASLYFFEENLLKDTPHSFNLSS